jgi:hypothetical protein
MDAFAAELRARADAQHVAHLRALLPERTHDLSDASLIALVRYGRRRAAAYDVVRDPDVRLFLEVMMVWGADFDADPALPWAREALAGGGPYSPTERVMRLRTVSRLLEKRRVP